jgi:hypothetical protein
MWVDSFSPARSPRDHEMVRFPLPATAAVSYSRLAEKSIACFRSAPVKTQKPELCVTGTQKPTCTAVRTARQSCVGRSQ